MTDRGKKVSAAPKQHRADPSPDTVETAKPQRSAGEGSCLARRLIMSRVLFPTIGPACTAPRGARYRHAQGDGCNKSDMIGGPFRVARSHRS